MIRKIFSVAAGFAIASLFTWLLVREVSWHEVEAALSGARLVLLFVGLILLAADYGVRIVRWQMLLSFTGDKVTYVQVISPLLAGFAANNILPFRIGDVMRVVMLRRATRTSLANGVGTLLIERVWDLATLSLLFVAGLQADNARSVSQFVPTAMGLVCVGAGALMLVALFANPLANRLVDIKVKHPLAEAGLRLTGKLCRALADISRPMNILRLSILSLMVWGIEGLVLYCCGLALHMALPFSVTYFILASANLSGLLPGTPGNVGTFHYFAVLAATSFGVNADQAAALAILFHALMWVPITLSGLICLVASPIGFRKGVLMKSISARGEF
jgi:uncharacterized protein (TIRG00374 family)